MMNLAELEKDVLEKRKAFFDSEPNTSKHSLLLYAWAEAEGMLKMARQWQENLDGKRNRKEHL